MGMPKTKSTAKNPRREQKPSRVALRVPKVQTLKKYALPSGTAPEDYFPGWKEAGATLPEVYFAVEYLSNGFDASKAYREVFPDAPTKKATFFGNAYLRKPTVQKILQEYTTAWLRGRVAFLEKEIMDTTLARALYDPSMFLTPDGEPAFRDWNEIPEAYRRCIEGIDVKFWGKDADRQSVTYNLANRSDALGQLTKLLSIIKTGMDSQQASSGLTAETELLLSTMFAQGRKVDTRPPLQQHATQVREALPPPPSAVITGLG